MSMNINMNLNMKINMIMNMNIKMNMNIFERQIFYIGYRTAPILGSFGFEVCLNIDIVPRFSISE
jgi:hypothetical protein